MDRKVFTNVLYFINRYGYYNFSLIKNPYRKPGGFLDNLEEVFGKKTFFWLLPTTPLLEEKLKFNEIQNI